MFDQFDGRKQAKVKYKENQDNSIESGQYHSSYFSFRQQKKNGTLFR